MNIIQANPFRILGVYSNAKAKEISANATKIKRYLAVNKTIEFPTDFNSILPPVLRTIENVDKALTQINLPLEKIKYALFWFINVTPIDDMALKHLQVNNKDKASELFNKKTSFSSLLNNGILSMITEDYDAAIDHITTLIHDNDSDGLTTDFAEAICGDTFQISEDDLAHLFIDALYAEKTKHNWLKIFNDNGVSSDDDDYIKEKTSNEPISKINTEIANARNSNNNDADASYKAGIDLIKNTKDPLEQIKQLLTVEDTQYQILADNLAKQILQCGINYFNNTEDDDKIEKTLKLQEYALNIAVGKLTKDRCKENAAILHKRQEENHIKFDIDFIAKQINNLKTNPLAFFSIQSILTKCQPHLSNIKQFLGSHDDVYLEISSAVGNNALNSIVSAINSIQSSLLGFNPTQPRVNPIELKKNEEIALKQIDNALSSIKYIQENIDKTQELNDRLIKNTTILKSLKQHILSRTNHASDPVHKPNTSPGGCYIATMVYGDYNHPQVMVLRNFRDSVLQQSILGRAFIKFYYRYSPTWVEHLKNRKSINNIIRSILDKFIKLYKHNEN